MGDLEAPYRDGHPDWGSMYRARGDEVSPLRPIFTGDIFESVLMRGSSGREKARRAIVLQHPCALRTDGVRLQGSILVAEVCSQALTAEEDWSRHFAKMPLPDLKPESERDRHKCADFDKLQIISPDVLLLEHRVASLSQLGLNLLFQRWVHYSSRVVVETKHFEQVLEAQFEEADLLEGWLEDAEARLSVAFDAITASDEFIAWLREGDAPTRQERLENAQERSAVRQEMRVELRRRRDC